MSFLKPNGAVPMMLAALAVLASTWQPALADTTTLICTVPGAAGPTTIDLNEAAGSITLHYPPFPNPGGRPDPIPGTLWGTFAAKFSPNAITFVDQEGNQRTLNRLTGILDLYGTNIHPISSSWTCHAAKPQF